MIIKADKKQTMVFSKTQYHANKRYQINQLSSVLDKKN